MATKSEMQKINAAMKLLEKAGYLLEKPVPELQIGDIVWSADDGIAFLLTMKDENDGEFPIGGTFVGSTVKMHMLWVHMPTYQKDREAYKILGHVDLTKAESIINSKSNS